MSGETTFSLELVRVVSRDDAASARAIASALNEDIATVRDALSHLPMFVRHAVPAVEATELADKISRAGCDVRLVNEVTGGSIDIDALVEARPSGSEPVPESLRPGAGKANASARAAAALRSLKDRGRPASVPRIARAAIARPPLQLPTRSSLGPQRAASRAPIDRPGAQPAAAPAASATTAVAKPASAATQAAPRAASTPPPPKAAPAAAKGASVPPPAKAASARKAPSGSSPAARPSAKMRAAGAQRPDPNAGGGFNTKVCISCGASVERMMVCAECGWHKYDGTRECPTCHSKVGPSFVPAPRQMVLRGVYGTIGVAMLALMVMYGTLGLGIGIAGIAIVIEVHRRLLVTRCTKCATRIVDEQITPKEVSSLNMFRRALQIGTAVVLGLSVVVSASAFQRGLIKVELDIDKDHKVTWSLPTPAGQVTSSGEGTAILGRRIKFPLMKSMGGFGNVALVFLAVCDAGAPPSPGDQSSIINSTLTNVQSTPAKPPVEFHGTDLSGSETTFNGKVLGRPISGRVRALVSGTTVIVVGAGAYGKDGADGPGVLATFERLAH